MGREGGGWAGFESVVGRQSPGTEAGFPMVIATLNYDHDHGRSVCFVLLAGPDVWWQRVRRHRHQVCGALLARPRRQGPREVAHRLPRQVVSWVQPHLRGSHGAAALAPRVQLADGAQNGNDNDSNDDNGVNSSLISWLIRFLGSDPSPLPPLLAARPARGKRGGLCGAYGGRDGGSHFGARRRSTRRFVCVCVCV